MYDLFNPAPDDRNISLTEFRFASIKGLKYVSNYITTEEQQKLISIIKAQPWLTDIRRRVQHYGYKYDYKARNIDYSMFLGELPEWALEIGKRLYADKYMDVEPDQVIINEYLPGQGIANHIDCEPCFGETIISISLCSTCIMDFTNKKTKEKIEVFLAPGSLVVISDEARHEWTHGIPARKTDIYMNKKVDRQLRLSMTFRKVIITDQKANKCD